MSTYNTDANAVRAIQQAVGGAGYTPRPAVTGVFDAATAAGVRWLQQTGGSGPASGVIDDGLLAALGIDPHAKGFRADPPPEAPPAPAPPPPRVKPAVAILGGAAGFALGLLGGALGAAVGLALGLVGGALLSRRSA